MSETGTKPIPGPHLYRSNPIQVEAVQYLGPGFLGNDVDALQQFGAQVQPGLNWGDDSDLQWTVQIYNSLEDQWIKAPQNHFIIKGTKGEYYPCDPEVFHNKYIRLD